MKLALYMLPAAQLSIVCWMGYRFGPEALTMTAIMWVVSSIATLVALVVYMRETNP